MRHISGRTGKDFRMAMDDVQDEIAAECSTLTDQVEMYEYLISWGERLEPLDDRFRDEDHAVPGCQASTWIRVDHRDGIIHCTADSDSAITRGMIALVLRVINDHAPGDILRTELTFIDRIGLRSRLSPTRSHGLNSILELLRERIGAHVTDPRC
jgi:cysteine desulfuration protein SufE